MVSIRADRPQSKRKRTGSDILDRQPPYSKEAEMAVLGSILQRPEVCDEVAMILRPADFYDNAHQLLYEHMMSM